MTGRERASKRHARRSQLEENVLRAESMEKKGIFDLYANRIWEKKLGGRSNNHTKNVSLARVIDRIKERKEFGAGIFES